MAAPGPPSTAPHRIEIRDRLDIHDAQSKARPVAKALGFSSHRIAEALVVVSELATNILRHSSSGSVELAADPASRTFRVTARDAGPLIADFARAQQDGSGPQGPILASQSDSPFGSSTGLGAVHRLSDTVEHTANAAGGNDITARLHDPALRGRARQR